MYGSFISDGDEAANVPQVVSAVILVQELKPSLRISVHSPHLLYKHLVHYNH